jgi:hypothetical protein
MVHRGRCTGILFIAFGREFCRLFAMLVHNVYFWLKPELTAAQRADFRRGVETLMAIKPHVVQGYVGAPATVPDQPAIDQSFAVGLTAIFRDIAAHNAYQTDAVHLAFLGTFKSYWTRVQVYDAE